MTIGISKSSLNAPANLLALGNPSQFLIQNRWVYDAVEVAGGGGISQRTSLGLFGGMGNFGTITGAAPSDTLPSSGHFATGTGAGTSAGFQAGAVYRLKQLSSIKFRARLNQGTLCRIWMAFTSSNLNTADYRSNDPGNANLGNGVGWRYSTPAGDTTFQGCAWQHNSVISTVDTHIVPDTANFHYYEIAYNGTSILFKYDGVLVATQNSLLPVGTPPPGSNYSLSAGIAIDNVALGNDKSFEYISSYAQMNQP